MKRTPPSSPPPKWCLSDAKASAEDQAKAKAKIEEIAQRIKAGEDFGEVAKEVSEDPGSGPQGGELGWFAHGQMVPEFDKASFALNPGELSEPVKTQFGWHLIQLEEKKAAGQKPLDEVKDQIRTRLAQDEASGKVQEALEQVQLAVIGGKSLKEAGEPLKLAPQETGLVNTTELTEKMGIKPENLPALLAAKPGTVLDTPFVTKTGYVIAKVNESKPQTVKPLDAVKDDIKARLQQDKARTLAFEAANAERKTFTADLPKELQGKLKKTEPVGRQGYMGELGMNAELAKAAGIRLIVGNLYIGGCSLERHWENVSKGLPAYDYRKNCEGVQSNTPKTSLLSALQDEPWDYITVQQVSQNSGLYDTYYPFMPSLLQYLRTHATNPGVRFAIHQVWAYACDSNHSGFANYDNNQSRMYREIVKTVNRVSRKEHIPIVIPSGTAIQTGRNLMGDRMTRDGFHLDYGLGRYIAACTWYETFFGPVEGNPFHPESVSPREAALGQRIAHTALQHPDEPGVLK